MREREREREREKDEYLIDSFPLLLNLKSTNQLLTLFGFESEQPKGRCKDLKEAKQELNKCLRGWASHANIWSKTEQEGTWPVTWLFLLPHP